MMLNELNAMPSYAMATQSLQVLGLPFSASELHGIICAFISTEANGQHSFVQTLLYKIDKLAENQAALQVIFSLETLLARQLQEFDFDFELLLPDDEEPLAIRAQAFSEWCAAFSSNFKLSTTQAKQLEEEEHEALRHIKEFAALDYHNLEISENDEKAFFEVTQYTKVTILRISHFLLSQHENAAH